MAGNNTASKYAKQWQNLTIAQSKRAQIDPTIKRFPKTLRVNDW